MTGSGWRQELRDLARDAMRVLFVYALALQTLVPLAAAQASDNPGGPPVLCSAMAAAHPAQAPARIVHDCLSCCLGGAVGVLPAPAELPEPTGFSLLPAPAASKILVLPALAGRSPSQRAPPDLV